MKRVITSSTFIYEGSIRIQYFNGTCITKNTPIFKVQANSKEEARKYILYKCRKYYRIGSEANITLNSPIISLE